MSEYARVPCEPGVDDPLDGEDERMGLVAGTLSARPHTRHACRAWPRRVLLAAAALLLLATLALAAGFVGPLGARSAEFHCSAPFTPPQPPPSSPPPSAGLPGLAATTRALGNSARLSPDSNETWLGADAARGLHEQAMLEEWLSNRHFVDAATEFSAVSSQPLHPRSPMEDDPSSSLLPLHSACSAPGVKVRPLAAHLDYRAAPLTYEYTVSEAIGEACSAGRRPSLVVSWGHNVCHDENTYVQSLQQNVTSVSEGNGAGELTFKAYGRGLTHATTHSVGRFLVVAYGAKGDVKDLQPLLKGRLVGPSILQVRAIRPLNSTRQADRDVMARVMAETESWWRPASACYCDGPCSHAWLVEYEVFDAGLYVLELRTTWLKRYSRWSLNVTLQDRPHAWLHTVYRGVTLVSESAGAERDTSQPCRAGEYDASRGRWLPLPSRPSAAAVAANSSTAVEYYCDGVVCSGNNTGAIIDEHGFSDDFQQQWVWKPLGCSYHLYTAAELTGCLSSRNFSHVHVHGDSLAREQFQNLVMLLDLHNAVDLPQTRGTAASLLATSDSAYSAALNLGSFTLNVHFDLGSGVQTALYNHTRRLMLWSPRIIVGLYQEQASYSVAAAAFYSQMTAQASQCREAGRATRCYYFVNPTVQHMYKAAQRSVMVAHSEKGGMECLTDQLHRVGTTVSVSDLATLLLPGANRTASSADDAEPLLPSSLSSSPPVHFPESVFGDALTAARWDSTHAGMHYSCFCHVYRCWLAEDCRSRFSPSKCARTDRPRYQKQWQGGVSSMVTISWLNDVCTATETT